MHVFSSFQASLARRAARLRRTKSRRTSRLRRGLTLVELAIVILVLGVIMAIVFSNLDLTALDKAKVLAVKSSSKVLPLRMQQFEMDNPSLQDGQSLTVLAKKTASNPNPVDEDSILDPWRNPYFICLDDLGDKQICSYGADAEFGGENENADFYLTDKSSWPTWLSGKVQE